MIHEIRHFTLMTELLTFTIYFAFVCKPIWGNASVSRYYRSPCPDIFGNSVPPIIFRGTAFPRVPLQVVSLAMAVIFNSINYSMSAMPTWPCQKSLNRHLKLYLSNKTAKYKMVKTGQFTTKCKGNKVIALKRQISSADRRYWASFWDIVSYLLKVANFPYPTCIWLPIGADPIFSKILGIRKLLSELTCV